jgi:hypothetical protein
MDEMGFYLFCWINQEGWKIFDHAGRLGGVILAVE